jgi:hypothetical protein
MYGQLLATFACLPFHPLISARAFVPQSVPLLKRLGLNALFLARRPLRRPMHDRMRVIGMRSRVRHSRNLALIKRALTLCLEATHNVSMLRRVNVLERGIYICLAVIIDVVGCHATKWNTIVHLYW